MKLKKDNNDYSEEYVKKHRTFPVWNTVWLVLCILLQIGALLSAVLFTPTPKDVIKDYRVTVYPREDGKLDIEYSFVWQAVDQFEPLSWVEIGMANNNYIVDRDVSATIADYSYVTDGDYVALRLDFAKNYYGGNIVEFSFKITQSNMLCGNKAGYYYEFVPGWFNSIPVEHYEFRWKKSDSCLWAEGSLDEGDYYLWSGSFEPGEYKKMYVGYNSAFFNGAETISHYEFDSSDAYNELAGDKLGVVVLAIIIIMFLAVAEIFIIDSYVSYGRGRGFLTGYGHHVHTYGRSNPHYVRQRAIHTASSSHGSSGGRGCACACACACAGGGRAGCSQKDGFSTLNEPKKK